MMNSMPNYNKFLHILRLKGIYIYDMEVVDFLGYKYDENKRIYYADGHEREDDSR